MTISIHRLRRLAEQRLASHAALTEAWDQVLSARKDLSRATVDLETYRSGGGAHRNPAGERHLADAVKAARARLAHAEANHDRFHEAWELSANLAQRGFEFARNHIAIPTDIQESFR